MAEEEQVIWVTFSDGGVCDRAEGCVGHVSVSNLGALPCPLLPIISLLQPFTFQRY